MINTFKDNLLKGKVAVVTGGATGILYGVTKGLLQFGCGVVIMSRKIQNIEKAVISLKQLYPNAEIFGTTCDVRNYEDCEKAIEFTLNKFKKIDILINGAAGNFLASLDQLSAKGYKTVIEIDTIGTFNMIKAVYEKAFKVQKSGGNIVNISATLHYNGTALQSHAGSAKAAIDALTKHLAVELGPQQIRVNGIAPGPIEDTEGFKKLRDPSVKDEDLSSYIPLQRNGKSEDIASAVLFLVSDAASYVTGATLQVDGAQWLSYPNFPFLSEMFRNVWKAKL